MTGGTSDETPRWQGSFEHPTLAMTVDYLIEDGWWVGQCREQANVISQGRTKRELIEMLQDAKEALDQSGE